MTLDLKKNKSQIAYQILAYLVEHPDAQDTLEGIVEWWLLDRQIRFHTARVKQAISELVAERLILENKGSDSKTHYRINRAKSKEIKEFFRQKDG